jgi:3',5'-cyclic-AMP phosphodiesterase
MSPTPALDRRTIIQISDVHAVGDGLLYGVADPLANLLAVLDLVDSSGAAPDAVIFSGDLADRGEAEAYQRFRSTTAPYVTRWGAPVVHLPGNHDVRAPFREHLLGLKPTDDTIDQVAWADGLRIVAIDSTVPGASHGELSDAQLSWLTEVLSVRAPLGTLLVLHHPPIPSPIEIMNEIGLRAPQRLASVVAGTDVAMVLSGHAHHTSAGTFAGVPAWVGTATAYQMDVAAGASGTIRGRSGSAFSRIDVAGAAAVATNVALPGGGDVLYEISAEELGRVLAGEAS